MSDTCENKTELTQSKNKTLLFWKHVRKWLVIYIIYCTVETRYVSLIRFIMNCCKYNFMYLRFQLYKSRNIFKVMNRYCIVGSLRRWISVSKVFRCPIFVTPISVSSSFVRSRRFSPEMSFSWNSDEYCSKLFASSHVTTSFVVQQAAWRVER